MPIKLSFSVKSVPCVLIIQLNCLTMIYRVVPDSTQTSKLITLHSIAKAQSLQKTGLQERFFSLNSKKRDISSK